MKHLAPELESLEVNCRLGDPVMLNLSSDTAAALPQEIQWMPPGTHQVWPESFKEPFTQVVTARIAELADAQLQERRSLAAAGASNWPFGDFDHEDGAQSFEPLQFFW